MKQNLSEYDGLETDEFDDGTLHYHEFDILPSVKAIEIQQSQIETIDPYNIGRPELKDHPIYIADGSGRHEGAAAHQYSRNHLTSTLQPMLMPAASQSPQLIHGHMHNSVIEYPQHMSNYPLEIPANQLQTLKKRKIKKTGKRRVNSIFNKTQMRFNDSSPIRLASNRRAAGVGLSVPIRIAPKDSKVRDTNKLA